MKRVLFNDYTILYSVKCSNITTFLSVRPAWRVDEVGNENKIPVRRKKLCPAKYFVPFNNPRLF